MLLDPQIEGREANTLPLVIWPDTMLHTNATFVDFENAQCDLIQLIADMCLTMKVNYGIGLAAPQVGVNLRVIVVSANHGLHYYINPTYITKDESTFTWSEGCLSVPGYVEERVRPNMVTVKYDDVWGKSHTETISALQAFALQHEIDHLNGKVFVDHLSPFKKERVRDKIRKTLKERSRCR